jgi:mono/diheme cytochrome c family protein
MRTSTLLALLLFPAASRAAEPIDHEFFEKKVRPLLLVHCTSCHGEAKQKGGLRLDSKAAFWKGGDTGTAQKLLGPAVQYDGDLKMPPKGKLPDADIATLTAWVKGGAPWPDDVAKHGTAAEVFDLAARAKAHWSFQPIKRPAVPGAGNPIDAFLLAKLRDNGLSFAPPAEKRVLVRRLYFDLIGLPPTPEEVSAFEKDTSAAGQ